MIAWLALSTALCTITSLAVWSRRPTMARGAAVAALLIVVPLSGLLLTTQRGWPVVPIPHVSALPDGEMDVLGAYMVPGEAIYLTLRVGDYPRLFVLSWNAEAASKLQRLMEGREGTGEIKATKRTGLTEEDSFPLEMHGAPQKPMPNKQPEAVNRYERSE